MMFASGAGFPSSYTEAGMTVTSLQDHLHFSTVAGNVGLLNHPSCCSTPYQFALDSGKTFDLISYQQIAGGAGDLWTSSTGGLFEPDGLPGLKTFPDGFTEITSADWDAAANSTIDDLKFVAESAAGS